MALLKPRYPTMTCWKSKVEQRSTLNSTSFYHFAVNKCDCGYYYALHALKCFGIDTTLSIYVAFRFASTSDESQQYL